MDRLTSKRTWEEAGKELGQEYGYSHIWKRLNQIEDILGDTYDIDRLKALASADKQGRVQIIPACKGDVCGACQHFQRIKGTRKGNCEIRPTYTSSINCHPWSKEYPFVAAQSRKACKNFAPIGDGCSHEEKAD